MKCFELPGPPASSKRSVPAFAGSPQATALLKGQTTGAVLADKAYDSNALGATIAAMVWIP